MKKYPVHLIAPSNEKEEVRFESGNTNDIIATIISADEHCAGYTKKFAPSLKGKDVIETCHNVWEFVKTQIPYKLDPEGYQFIKSPGKLWKDKSGDCKSFSIFCASILKNLGIKYGYRFASYKSDDPTPTHVYVYVPFKHGEIIVDAVWTGPFNTEKKFQHKKDVMPKIMYLGATAPQSGRGMLKLNKPVDQMTDGELSLLLAKQKLEIDQDNARSIGATYKVDGYQKQIDAVNHMLRNIDNPDAISGFADEMIGRAKKKGGKTFFGKLLKGVATGIKKGIKATTKVLTAPMRLMAKGAMEIYLPKAAPAFLYLFIPENLVAKIPDKMRAKRNKAIKFKKFVVDKLGMKDKHFMAIIRNNLTKRFKKSPESFLAAELKRTGIAAIGMHPYHRMVYMNQHKKRYHNKFRHFHAIGGIGIRGTYEIGYMRPIMMPSEDEAQQYDTPTKKGGKGKEDAKALLKTGASIVRGDFIGAIISAISWLIQKLGGKKAGVDFGKNDIPNIPADTGNAFNYGDLKNDYSNLDAGQKSETKSVVTDLIESDAPPEEAKQTIKKKLPYLNDNQVEEMASEVEEGYEPVSTEQMNSLAVDIKKSANVNPLTNGGGSTGWCSC